MLINKIVLNPLEIKSSVTDMHIYLFYFLYKFRVLYKVLDFLKIKEQESRKLFLLFCIFGCIPS